MRLPPQGIPVTTPVSDAIASCSFNQSLYSRSVVLIHIIHYYDGIRFSSNVIAHDMTLHQTLLNVLHTPIGIHSFIDEFTCSKNEPVRIASCHESSVVCLAK